MSLLSLEIKQKDAEMVAMSTTKEFCSLEVRAVDTLFEFESIQWHLQKRRT